MQDEVDVIDTRYVVAQYNRITLRHNKKQRGGWKSRTMSENVYNIKMYARVLSLRTDASCTSKATVKWLHLNIYERRLGMSFTLYVFLFIL